MRLVSGSFAHSSDPSSGGSEVVSSGGIADGYGLAAALVLGAEGVNMGTRFVATKEAPVHQNIKDMIVKAGERDTTLIFRTLHNTGRVLKNADLPRKRD